MTTTTTRVFAGLGRIHAVAFLALLALLSACAPSDLTSPNEVSPADSGSESNGSLDTSTQLNASKVAAETAGPASTPSDNVEPTLTPLPLFGQKVPTPVFFERAQEYLLAGEDIYTLGKAEDANGSEDIEEVLGFVPFQFAQLPAGYSLGEVEIFAVEGTVRQCAVRSGSGSSGLPKICITQRASRLSDPIGAGATAFQLETVDLYIEYVYGGWLSVGNSWDPVSTYRWDDRMVPVLHIRFEKDGLYLEVSCVGGECPELSELVGMIEQESSP